jgi:hypothetical protein
MSDAIFGLLLIVVSALVGSGITYRIMRPRWRCLRCGQKVDMKAFRCGCDTSPSPWAPIP